MECVRLLGESEHSEGDRVGITMESELLLRFLTPLCKMYTAKCAVFCASEGIECLGGIGYLETTNHNMARIWRDAQVLPVWEGTTNVLALDALRVISHSKSGQKTLHLCYQRMDGILQGADASILRVKQEIDALKQFMERFGGNKALCSLFARDIAYSFCRVYGAAMLYQHAKCSGKG